MGVKIVETAPEVAPSGGNLQIGDAPPGVLEAARNAGEKAKGVSGGCEASEPGGACVRGEKPAQQKQR